MSDQLLARTQPVYEALCDAILAGDRPAVDALCGRLVEELLAASEGPDLAMDMAADLHQCWVDLEEEAAEPGGPAELVRTLLLDCLVRLGEALPDPAFAVLFEYRALDLLETDPERAAELLRQAVDLAEDDEERASYLVGLMFALSGAGEAPEQLLPLAEEARALAVEKASRELADACWLELLCDLEDPRVGEFALGMLHEPLAIASDALGAALMRALIAEAARLEALDQAPSEALTEGLRLGLSRPDWVPEPLTRSDYAVAVAWTEFMRDDTSRLLAMLEALSGPFSDPGIEARAGMLRMLAALQRWDTAAMERELRATAPVVRRSGSPQLASVFRVLAESMNQTRSGAPIVHIPTLLASALPAGNATEAMELFQDVIAALQLVNDGREDELPDALPARLDRWCAVDEHPGAYTSLDTIVWLVAANVAARTGSMVEAQRRFARGQALRRSLPSSSMEGPMLDMALDLFSSGLLVEQDPEGAVKTVRELAARHRDAGNFLAASVTDHQLTIILGESHPEETLAAAARALAYRARQGESFAGSSERTAFKRGGQRMVAAAMRAASLHQDPRVMAELLEFLRAQEMPEVPDASDVMRLPLALLFPSAAPDGADPPMGDEFLDATTLPAGRRVLMPWGTVALADVLPPADGEGRVPLTIPVPGTT